MDTKSNTNNPEESIAYQPTKGVRILESEKKVQRNGNSSINVECWDVAGDQTMEKCWPAIMENADGVMLCYNPGNRTQEHEITLWYEWFITNTAIAPGKCLLLVHDKDGKNKSGSSLNGLLGELKTVHTNPRALEQLRDEYEDYIATLAEYGSSDRRK